MLRFKIISDTLNQNFISDTNIYRFLKHVHTHTYTHILVLMHVYINFNLIIRPSSDLK